MAQPEEPMDVDSSMCDFDNKENAYQHENLPSRTEKGYEELDVAELNMKLRYSMPPTSPMSKSYTVDNRTFDFADNGNMTQSLHTTLPKSEKPKDLPLQYLTSDHTENRSVLRTLDATVTLDTDIKVTISTPHETDEYISLPSSSSSLAQTPEVTTPTNDMKDGGSPIMRGIKSVLNMFRPSQSPIPPDGDALKSEMLSPPIVNSPHATDNQNNQSLLVSTPLAARRTDMLTKRTSPNKETVVFNEDLEKELLWKDESTILFDDEKVPLHKLFLQIVKSEAPKPTANVQLTEKPMDVHIGRIESPPDTELDSTVEYLDISYENKTFNAGQESDSEFVDCETTFNKNESLFSAETSLDNIEFLDSTKNIIDQLSAVMSGDTVNVSTITLEASNTSVDLSSVSTVTSKHKAENDGNDIQENINIEDNKKNMTLEEDDKPTTEQDQMPVEVFVPKDQLSSKNAYQGPATKAAHVSVSLADNINDSPIISYPDKHVKNLSVPEPHITENKSHVKDFDVAHSAQNILVQDNLHNANSLVVNSLSQIPLIADPRVLLFNISSEMAVEGVQVNKNVESIPSEIPLPDDDELLASLSPMNDNVTIVNTTTSKDENVTQNISLEFDTKPESDANTTINVVQEIVKISDSPEKKVSVLVSKQDQNNVTKNVEKLNNFSQSDVLPKVETVPKSSYVSRKSETEPENGNAVNELNTELAVLEADPVSKNREVEETGFCDNSELKANLTELNTTKGVLLPEVAPDTAKIPASEIPKIDESNDFVTKSFQHDNQDLAIKSNNDAMSSAKVKDKHFEGLEGVPAQVNLDSEYAILNNYVSTLEESSDLKIDIPQSPRPENYVAPVSDLVIRGTLQEMFPVEIVQESVCEILRDTSTPNSTVRELVIKTIPSSFITKHNDSIKRKKSTETEKNIGTEIQCMVETEQVKLEVETDIKQLKDKTEIQQENMKQDKLKTNVMESVSTNEGLCEKNKMAIVSYDSAINRIRDFLNAQASEKQVDACITTDGETENQEYLTAMDSSSIRYSKDQAMIKSGPQAEKIDQTMVISATSFNNKATDEEIVLSENSSPFVSLTQNEVIPDSSIEINKNADNYEEIENPCLSSDKIKSPPKSPPIASKGYNFNFDEIEDPFATKTKIRQRPDVDDSPNQTFSHMDDTLPVEEIPIPQKVNRTISKPPQRNLYRANKKRNSTLAGSKTIDTKPKLKNGNQLCEKLDMPESIKIEEQNQVMKLNEEIKVKAEHETHLTSIDDVKPFSAGTVTENVTKVDFSETDDPNYNPFATKTKIQMSPPPSLNATTVNLPKIDDPNFNPFTTKTKIQMSPPPSLNATFASANDVIVPEVDDPEFDPFATKIKTQNSPPPILNGTFDKSTNLPGKTISSNANEIIIKSPKSLSPIPREVAVKDKESVDQNVTLLSKTSTMQSIQTVCSVNTEDQDTIEGPFLDEMELQEDEKMDLDVDHGMFDFGELPPGNEENAEGEMFIDAEAFEFLLNQNQTNAIADSGKESLFLKFDPLFAKRSSGVGLSAFQSMLKRDGHRTPQQNTPNATTQQPSKIIQGNVATISQDIKMNTPHQVLNSPLREIKTPPHRDLRTPPRDSGFLSPHSFAATSKINKSVDADGNSGESSDDVNVTVAKPTMVVSPAVNPVVTPRKATIPSRRSVTFTSPAIAVIDRLLSISTNNSGLGHESMLMSQDTEADHALVQLRELLAEKEMSVQNLRMDCKDLRERLGNLESQMKTLEAVGQERLKKINSLNDKLNDTLQENKSMARVVEEYERTIASLITETEQDKKRHAEERMQLTSERDEATSHLSSMEISFSDLHSKYEKSKQIIFAFKANDEALKNTQKDFEEKLAKMQSNYESLKQHATAKLNHANEELQKINRAHEAEVLKLNAMLKRKEVDVASLEETLAQKIKTNEELSSICDSLLARFA